MKLGLDKMLEKEAVHINEAMMLMYISKPLSIQS